MNYFLDCILRGSLILLLEWFGRIATCWRLFSLKMGVPVKPYQVTEEKGCLCVCGVTARWHSSDKGHSGP